MAPAKTETLAAGILFKEKEKFRLLWWIAGLYKRKIWGHLWHRKLNLPFVRDCKGFLSRYILGLCGERSSLGLALVRKWPAPHIHIPPEPVSQPHSSCLSLAHGRQSSTPCPRVARWLELPPGEWPGKPRGI